nr:hypothetical protein [Tanacetum cinerariifolium]
IDITPTTLDHYYDVELADGRIIRKSFVFPGGNETLIVRGDESDWGNETRLNIISCTKTQSTCSKDATSFWHILLQRRLKTSRKRSDLRTYRSFEIFLNTGTLSIGPVRNEGIVRPAEGAIRQRLYKAQFLTLGSSVLVFQEEGWIILNVHRLSRTEQANGEESISTPND